MNEKKQTPTTTLDISGGHKNLENKDTLVIGICPARNLEHTAETDYPPNRVLDFFTTFLKLPFLPISIFKQKSNYQSMKRVLDILLCLLALPLLMPIGILVAIAIRLDSTGPIFFIQDRVGKDGKIFKIIKFRTMYHNIDDRSHREFMKQYISGQMDNDGQPNKTFKPFKANQITRIGRILRKTSLDELPQLINVFKDEMSFVGPRPNVTWEVEAYNEWHAERLKALPGITGLAQIRGRSQITFDEIVKYDIEYIEKQSIKLDMQILWWTIASVLFSTGAE